MDLGLEGRVALVTGASTGIGLGIARALAAEGANLAVASRSSERIEAAAAELGARPYRYDSAELDAIPGLIEAVAGDVGPIEVLVINTGGPPGGDPLGFPREAWRDAHRDLVLAPMTLIESVAPSMREHGFGRILNVASTSVREPIPNLMLSNAHRSGIVAAFKTLARQLGGDGITLNSILPGRIGTDRLGEIYGSLDDAERVAEEQVPAGRLGTVEEVAVAAAFLCSARASYITGVALPVDGGLLQSV